MVRLKELRANEIFYKEKDISIPYGAIKSVNKKV